MSTSPHSRPTAPMQCVCAWCLRWQDAAGEWCDPPAPAVAPKRVTHGICPACERTQLAGSPLEDTPSN